MYDNAVNRWEGVLKKSTALLHITAVSAGGRYHCLLIIDILKNH